MKKSGFLLSFLISLMILAIPFGALGATLENSGDGTGTWIIKIKEDVSSLAAVRNEVNSVADDTQGEMSRLVIGDTVFYTTDNYETALSMADSDLVESVQESGFSQLSYTPNDKYYQPASSHTTYQYAPRLLKAEPAWGVTQGSSDVRIVVIDSGFYYGHEDAANIKAGWDYVMNKQNTFDYSWHGTASAGIIGATTGNEIGIAGAAPNCEVIMLWCFGRPEYADGADKANNDDIARAIRDAVDVYDADVISMSFGTPVNVDAIETAVQYAYGKGAIMVAACGNRGDKSYNRNAYEYPASYDEVIGVGSVDWAERVASSSTQNGSTSVTAPGCAILTLDNYPKTKANYTSATGTSFATPYVAALAGLALSVEPDLTPNDFKTILRYTAKDLGAAGYDYSYGYGLVNYEAVINTLSQGKFVDVPDGQWFSSAIYSLKSKGIINGRTNLYFQPGESITRAEFAKILAVASHQDLQAYNGPSSFSDVAAKSWYLSYINWGNDVGIIEGYGDGRAKPDANISREEMCTMLKRFIDLKGIDLGDAAAANFSDTASISSWASESVFALVKGGIIQGNDDNTFRPANNASRAEVAVMIDRFLQKHPF